MSLARRCSRTPCGRPAVATLTYVYADQTAVLGPLATYAEPHAYDLCETHSERLSAPRGWEVLRLPIDRTVHGPNQDDLLALADAVREAGRPLIHAARAEDGGGAAADGAVRLAPGEEQGRETTRRGHLRVLTTD